MTSATDYIVSLIKQGGGKRLLKLYFPRDDGPNSGLLVNQLHALEGVSTDFVYTVTVLSDDPHIELKDVLCKMVCVELLRADKSSRYFNGYCHEFSLQRIENSLAVYQMVLKPWLAFFDLRRDYHIFQDQNIEQQTKAMFLEMGISHYELRLHESDPVQTYSVQYNETDYNYLHRQWERMGWHYYYEHSLNNHKLVLCSTSPACDQIDGAAKIAFHHDGGHNKGDKIGRFTPVRQVVSGKVAMANFDFKSPTPQRMSETSAMRQGEIHKIEVYDYEGLYGYKNEADGRNIARRRMEQIDAAGKYFQAEGDHRHVQPGRWFALARDHEGQSFDDGDAANEFFILKVEHRATNNYLNAAGQQAEYKNEFTCLRRHIPWRPEPGFNSQLTRVTGVDTATVAGPAGEEIHTDKYGRIKVQFHWDRIGKNDENSSCWLRVMTPWADSGFGMIALPRIGTEVVVQYLQGNPDRPLVVGQLYNQSHMPPWDLPANKTQSGILSRSSKGGSAANANAFRFEDEKGKEEVWLHAEKDQRIEVENDESHWVGHDRSKTIDHDETVHVKHDRTETVDHDETITVHHNRTETVDNDETIHIKHDRTETVDNNETIHVKHDRTETVDNNEKITIHNNRSERVDHNEEVSIGDNRSNTIGKNLTETVKMMATQNVGMAKMTNVGGAYSINVAMVMNTMVGLSQTAQIIMGKQTSVGQDYAIDVGKHFKLSAGESIELVVGKSVLKMDKDGHFSINGHEIILGATGEQFYKADGNITIKAKNILEN